MTTYKERYEQIKKQEEEFVDVMLNEIVALFTIVWLKPVTIGNMVYYYCEENGKKVPAYCYLSDYERGAKTFLPIYDRFNEQEYGWSELEDVARILDKIREKFFKEFKN